MKFCNLKFRDFLFTSSIAAGVQFIVSLVASVFAGRLLGEAALAGVSILAMPFSCINGTALLIGTGSSILFLKAMGSFDAEGARRTFSCGFFATIGASAIMAAAMATSGGAYLSFMGVEPEVAEMAASYWNAFIAVTLTCPLCVYLTTLVYADGDNRLCNLAYAVQLVTAIALTRILCGTIGIAGCAYGAASANLAAIAVLCFHFRRPGNSLRLVRYFSSRMTARFATLAFGDAGTQFCWAALFLVLNKFAVTRFGADRQPVVAAVLALMGLVSLFDGLGSAAQPLVEVYAEERNFLRVREVMRTALLWAISLGSAFTVLFGVFPGAFMRLVGIDDPATLAAAVPAVRIISLAAPFWAIALLYNSYYLFVERPAFSVTLTVASFLVFPLVMMIAGGIAFGETGMWLGFLLGVPAAIAVTAAAFRARLGKGRFPLAVPADRDANVFMVDLALDERGIAGASAAVEAKLRERGLDSGPARHAPLIVEEALMVVKDRNGKRKVHAEVSLDMNGAADPEEGVSLILRDDGVVFDITDDDAAVSSLRVYLVAMLMSAHKNRRNLTTTGFNRNQFAFRAR